MFTASGYAYYPLKAFADIPDLCQFAIDHELHIELWLEGEATPRHVKPLHLSTQGFLICRQVETIQIGVKDLGPETMVRLGKVTMARLCRAVGLDLDAEGHDLLSSPPRPPV